MSTVKTPTTIPKVVSSQDDLDFQYLKRLGIEYIESLGGNLWTDYNTHDPGVTILDMLCYAITDLGNRIELPIGNLLSKEDGSGFDTQFYTASEILPNRATTALDYRKLFIDIDGVRNCWLRPHKRTVYVNCKDNELAYSPTKLSTTVPQFIRNFDLKGLYDILIDFDIPDTIDPDSQAYQDEVNRITREVRNRYHANRNLCEDLIDVSAVETQPVSVCASIELERDADEERVHADVLFAIQRYFAPFVNFYSLKEMLDRGYRTDQIFEGPLLDHGFIDTEELRQSKLRTEVRLSDIMNLISSIDGVKVIKEISIGNCDGSDSTEDWLLCIQDQKRPVLCDNSTFSYSKDVLPLVLSEAKVEEYLAILRAQLQMNRTLSSLDKELTLPASGYLDTDWYTTIQNDFPDVYGIGKYGLPSTASVARKSQAKQLKAYLLFFDQVLASYFAQLGVVKDLLSFDSDLKRTYYTQTVQDIAGFSELVDPIAYPQNDNDLLSENLLGELDDINERRNQLLDHLIARFAEKFSEYTFLMKQLYGTASTELVVKSKQDFLKNYVDISANRGGAFNYYHQYPATLWDTDNVSGAEKRIARLTGFKEKYFWRRFVSNSFVKITELVVDNETIYLWHILDDTLPTPLITLKSALNYTTIPVAMDDMHHAVMQIIQTPEEVVEQMPVVADGDFVGNFLVRENNDNTYYFDVVSFTGDLTGSYDTLGTHSASYATLADLKAGMLELIAFMKHRFSEEGIFLVEHILLRPNVHNDFTDTDVFIPVSLDDCKDCSCVDPYSYRVSVILPGYTQRFSDMDFRNFMERLIREELPAHILPKICWVGQRRGQVPDSENDLHLFEQAYRNFLDFLSFPEGEDQEAAIDPTIIGLNEAMANLNTIYPTGRLHDCDSNEINGKIILGRTNLGTL